MKTAVVGSCFSYACCEHLVSFNISPIAQYSLSRSSRVLSLLPFLPQKLWKRTKCFVRTFSPSETFYLPLISAVVAADAPSDTANSRHTGKQTVKRALSLPWVLVFVVRGHMASIWSGRGVPGHCDWVAFGVSLGGEQGWKPTPRTLHRFHFHSPPRSAPSLWKCQQLDIIDGVKAALWHFHDDNDLCLFVRGENPPEEKGHHLKSGRLKAPLMSVFTASSLVFRAAVLHSASKLHPCIHKKQPSWMQNNLGVIFMASKSFQLGSTWANRHFEEL